MRFFKRYLKAFISIGLALLVAVLSILKLPQVALSYAQASVESVFHSQYLVADNYQIQDKSELQSLASKTSFPDVMGHWAQPYIEALAAKNIIVGYPDGKYRPDDPVTRAEFAVIINKAFAPAPQRPAMDFVDVPKKHWAYKDIQAVYQGSFLTGYPGRVFRPEPKMPRVEMLVSLATGLKLNPGDNSVLSFYEDASQIPSYATKSVVAATESQVVVNHPNLKRLNPRRSATRAEVAALVYQALVNAGKVAALPNPPGVVDVSPSGGTTGGSPNNGITVRITNADKVDGTPFTVGDVVSLSAVARNGSQDISSNIVWQNKDGQVLGNGASLNYRPTQAKNETIKAKAKASDGRENWAIVSFTVSSERDLIAPHTKVIDNQNSVAGVDLSRGLVCLKDDASMQTKLVSGDKLVSWFGSKFEVSENAPPRVVDQVERVLPPLQLGKQLSSGRVRQLLGSNYRQNLVCFEGTKIISDPSDLFNKPVERDFTPPNPISFEKSSFISPVTCKDLREGTLGWAEVPGITAREAQRLCSSGDENLTVGARDVQEGWTDDIEKAERNTPLPLACGAAKPGKAAIFLTGQLDGLAPEALVEVSADGVLRLPPLRPNPNGLNLPNGGTLDLKPVLQRLGIDLNDFLARRYRGGPSNPQDAAIRPDLNGDGNADGIYIVESPQPCPPPDLGGASANDPKFNIPLRKFRINIINNQKSKVKVGKWNESNGEDKIVDRNKRGNYQQTQREAYAIKSDAYVGFGFKPRMSGKLNFKPFKLSVEGGATGKFIGGITLDALYVLEDQRQWTLLRVDGSSAPRIAFSIGPVPVWLAAYLQIPLKLNSGIGACIRQGVLGFESGADVNFKAPGGKLNTQSFTKPVFGGQAALEGFSALALEPRLQLLLYDVAGPALSVGGEVKAETALPKTTVKISSPAPGESISQSENIQLEAKIETVAPPEIQFSRRVYANFEPISASELLFPPYELEITPGFCVDNPGSRFGIGKKRYCVEPIKISFDLAGWLKGIFTLDAYNSGAIPMGKINLPALKGTSLGCPRIVWETEKQNLALENANQDLVSRSVTLSAGSLPTGNSKITAKAYSPFVLKTTQPLGVSDPVEIKVQ